MTPSQQEKLSDSKETDTKSPQLPNRLSVIGSCGNMSKFFVAWEPVSGRIIAHPQSLELRHEGLHQVCLLRDYDIFHVALHCCQRPVEGAGDEPPTIHHCKLMMHVHRADIAAHADPCGANGKEGGEQSLNALVVLILLVDYGSCTKNISKNAE